MPTTKQGYLKEHGTNNPLAIKTLDTLVKDTVKNQALSQTLFNTPDKDALGYPAFSTLVNYTAGQIVYYQNKLWKCKAGGHSAGPWNANDFTLTSIKDVAGGGAVIKDYAENNPEDSAYIQNRPGGYDYEIYSENSPIEYSDGFTRDSEEYDYILEDVIGETGDDWTLRQMLVHGYIIPCTYVPTDGDLAGQTLNGTITYEEEGEGVTLHSATGDDSTEAGSLSIDLSAIPNGELEDDIYHFPVQFPSKYIPHDSTKQNVLTFDNVPTQNSNNPVKSGGVYSDIKPIKDVIPAQASPINQLADKNFVNSSIQTATATFRGNFRNWDGVPFDYASMPVDWLENPPDNNDYMVVRDTSDYAPKWVAGYWPYESIVSDGEIKGEEQMYKCINPDGTDSSDSPQINTEDWEEVTSNPAYEGTWRFKYSPSGSQYDRFDWKPEYQVNEKPLTAAQLAALNSEITAAKVAKLDGLPATIPTEVFWATYGTTTYQEVLDAYNAGKLIIAVYGEQKYILSSKGSSSFAFFSGVDNNILMVSLSSADRWLKYNNYLQPTSGRVSSWSNTPSDNNYPSEKLVYDSLYKRGVISQTQTWTQAADGGYDYTIADESKVWGNIPQANIDLFVSAGATFNATTGYFELNGLTDISYEEMQKIYNEFQQKDGRYWSRLYLGSKIRTNLPFPWYGFYDDSTVVLNDKNSINFLIESLLEVFLMPPQLGSNVKFILGSPDSPLYSALYLKNIINPFGYSSSLSSAAFRSANSLEELQLFGLAQSIEMKYCSRLSLASILYMINNEAATSAITITLHATAYARATADADIQAALQNHPNVSLMASA